MKQLNFGHLIGLDMIFITPIRGKWWTLGRVLRAKRLHASKFPFVSLVICPTSGLPVNLEPVFFRQNEQVKTRLNQTRKHHQGAVLHGTVNFKVSMRRGRQKAACGFAKCFTNVPRFWNAVEEWYSKRFDCIRWRNVFVAHEKQKERTCRNNFDWNHRITKCVLALRSLDTGKSNGRDVCESTEHLACFELWQ